MKLKMSKQIRLTKEELMALSIVVSIFEHEGWKELEAIEKVKEIIKKAKK
jgi:hypothetical protein